jgi:hypothetical protein
MHEEINVLIPLAENVRKQGRNIERHLKWENNQIDRSFHNSDLWTRLVDGRGWKGKRMKKDLELSGQAIGVISDMVNKLQETRAQLIYYRANIKNFKVRFWDTRLTRSLG